MYHILNSVLILSKIKEWVRRYLPAEIAAIVGAMAGGLLVHQIFHSPVLTALGGTWGENVGYYGKIIHADIKARMQLDEKITLRGVVTVLRNAVIEFGLAEYFDSFLIRPLTMYFFTQWSGNIAIGLFLGKISADVTFYTPAIFFYELRKQYLKE